MLARLKLSATRGFHISRRSDDSIESFLVARQCSREICDGASDDRANHRKYEHDDKHDRQRRQDSRYALSLHP